MNFEQYALTHSMEGHIGHSRQILLDRFVKNEMVALDGGCGDGKHLEYLSKRMNRNNLFGTEISQIRVDRVKAKGFSCHKVDSVLLPFENETFDVIFFFEVIEHIPENDIPTFLTEFDRVIKPSGLILGTTPNYPIKRLYDFIRKLKSRLKNTNKHLTSINNQKKKSTDSTTLPKRNWLGYQVKRLFSDDPTHQYLCNFKMIKNLGDQFFSETSLFSTLNNKIEVVSPHSLKSYFSHKIAFVFEKRGNRDQKPMTVNNE